MRAATVYKKYILACMHMHVTDSLCTPKCSVFFLFFFVFNNKIKHVGSRRYGHRPSAENLIFLSAFIEVCKALLPP